MIYEPGEYVKVEIQDNLTGKVTQPQAVNAPKPGMVTIWDLRTGLKSDDVTIKVDWPMKEEPLLIAGRDFIQGWKHFLNTITWEQSNLDAEAVRFMNEVPGKIEAAVKEAQDKIEAAVK